MLYSYKHIPTTREKTKIPPPRPLGYPRIRRSPPLSITVTIYNTKETAFQMVITNRLVSSMRLSFILQEKEKCSTAAVSHEDYSNLESQNYSCKNLPPPYHAQSHAYKPSPPKPPIDSIDPSPPPTHTHTHKLLLIPLS